MCDLDDDDHTGAAACLSAINLSCLRLQYTIRVIKAINRAKAMAIAYRGWASTFDAGGEETGIDGPGVDNGSTNGIRDGIRDGDNDGMEVGT